MTNKSLDIGELSIKLPKRRYTKYKKKPGRKRKNKPGAGGKRPGAGAKPLYAEPQPDGSLLPIPMTYKMIAMPDALWDVALYIGGGVYAVGVRRMMEVAYKLLKEEAKPNKV